MNTTICIFVALFAILSLINLKVFLFQRTIRKVHIKVGIPQNALNDAYPPSYAPLYFISLLRYALIVALFIINWKIAVVCFAADYLLKILIPSQSDYKNLQKARKTIAAKIPNVSKEKAEYLLSLDELLNTIIETEYINH